MLSTLQKLEILADAAKYDASCASSGAEKRDSKNGDLGSTSCGICHSYTPDGRCVSLLKILLTNACVFIAPTASTAAPPMCGGRAFP